MSSYLAQEDGSHLTEEDGSGFLLLEGAAVTVTHVPPLGVTLTRRPERDDEAALVAAFVAAVRGRRRRLTVV